MPSLSRSPEPGLPLVPALVLLAGLAAIGLLAVFPSLRAPHPEFGMAAWLLLATCLGFFPLRAGLFSTATRRAPAPLVVRTRRRRSAVQALSPVAERTVTRAPRGGRRPGRRPLSTTHASC